MKTAKWSILALAVALVSACDPYPKENTGAPAVVAVRAVGGAAGEPVEGTANGAAWTVAPTSVCSFADAAVVADTPQYWVTFNKQLNADKIQTTPTDCTPAGDWLQVQPAAPAGTKWFTCYYPSAATPNEGGSIVIFQAPAEPADVATCSAATPAPDAWDVATPAEASANTVTSYHFTGTVADRNGNQLPIDFTAQVAPDPVENVRNLTVSATTATDVTLKWANRACAAPTDPTVHYTLYRADANGKYTIKVADIPLADTTYTVTGLTADKLESFELTSVTTPASGGPFETPKGTLANVDPGLGAPAAPAVTFASGATPTATITLAAPVAGATSYDVYRKTSATGAYSRLAASAIKPDANGVLTSTDTTVAGNTVYTYKAVPLKALTVADATVSGRGADSPDSTPIVTAPTKPAAAAVLETTDTTATLEWTIAGNVTTAAPGNLTWIIERAPDSAGTAGTYAPIAATATFSSADRTLTVTDTGLTPGTTYHYRVTLTNAAGTSPAGSDVTAETVALPAPVATLSGSTVSWTAVGGATSYEVARSLSNACGFETVATVTTTTFTDPTPTPGAFYTVTAKSATGNSAPSAPVGPTP